MNDNMKDIIHSLILYIYVYIIHQMCNNVEIGC